MNEYTPDLFELVDEDGNKKQFELFDAVEIDGEQYFALLPAIEDEDFLNSDCELVILKSAEEEDEEILVSIDDEDEFEKISSYFMERLQDTMDDDFN